MTVVARKRSQQDETSDVGASTSGHAIFTGGAASIEPLLGGLNMARRRGQTRGHVHKQGSAWYLAYREDALDENGKIVRIRRNRKIADAREVTKREAQRVARELLATVDVQSQHPGSLLTVEQFVESRFKPDVVWALKHAGKKHYAYILDNHVLPSLGGVKLRDVTSDHAQALVRRKIDAGYSVQTAVHVRNAISAVFKHAKLKRAYSGDNPAQGVRMPEMKRRESHALTFDQARALLDQLKSPSKEMALLSMMTSLNVAEMLGLRWKRVNLTGQAVMSGGEILPPFCLAVRENYYRGEFGSVKAKSRQRIVPLSATVIEALAAHRQRSDLSGPDELVFREKTGRPPSECNLLRRQLKPVGVRLGMPWLSWHAFRHTHATFGEQIGMTLSDRQAQMGHGDVRMTMHYTHSDLERRRESIEAMQRRLLGLTAA